MAHILWPSAKTSLTETQIVYTANTTTATAMVYSNGICGAGGAGLAPSYWIIDDTLPPEKEIEPAFSLDDILDAKQFINDLQSRV